MVCSLLVHFSGRRGSSQHVTQWVSPRRGPSHGVRGVVTIVSAPCPLGGHYRIHAHRLAGWGDPSGTNLGTVLPPGGCFNGICRKRSVPVTEQLRRTRLTRKGHGTSPLGSTALRGGLLTPTRLSLSISFVSFRRYGQFGKCGGADGHRCCHRPADCSQ